MPDVASRAGLVALRDDLRRHVNRRGPVTAGAVAAVFRIKPGRAAYNLDVLASAGLIVAAGTGVGRVYESTATPAGGVAAS